MRGLFGGLEGSAGAEKTEPLCEQAEGGGDRKVRRFLKGKGRGWRRKSKGSRRGIEGRKGRGKWEGERRKGIGQQFRSEGLFRVITSNTCEKIRTFIEFPRSVTP